MTTYSKTGNKIEINKTATILYVLLMLSEYDKSIEKNEYVDTDPYNDDIVMPTENNKYIVVPKELQEHAINQWNIGKKEKKEKKILHDYDNDNDNDNDDNENNDKNKKYNFLGCFILIIFIIIICYFVWNKNETINNN